MTPTPRAPRTLTLACLVVALVACGKRQESNNAAPTPASPVAPVDELSEILALEAKLYRDDLTADLSRCPDACVIAARICELSTRICDLAADNPKCTDATARCAKATRHVADRCTCSVDLRGAAPDGR